MTYTISLGSILVAGLMFIIGVVIGYFVGREDGKPNRRWYMGDKKLKELIKEFNEKHCPGCPSYLFCGGEILLACKAFNKFLNEKV